MAKAKDDTELIEVADKTVAISHAHKVLFPSWAQGCTSPSHDASTCESASTGACGMRPAAPTLSSNQPPIKP